jgi:hypothetical protein
MRKIKWIFLLTVTVLLFVSPCVNAEFVTHNKEVLRGIKSIGVEIGKLPHEARNLGITRDSLRKHVESKLRLAGINVATPDELKANPEIPFLLVAIVIGYNKPTCIYAVTVSLNEKVQLKRDPKIISYATPWWRIMKGEHIGEAGIERDLENTLTYLLNEFTNDYLAVNPK